jgi:hypothetical protein
MDEEPEVAEK